MPSWRSPATSTRPGAVERLAGRGGGSGNFDQLAGAGPAVDSLRRGARVLDRRARAGASGPRRRPPPGPGAMEFAAIAVAVAAALMSPAVAGCRSPGASAGHGGRRQL